jgi:hypothetical protein
MLILLFAALAFSQSGFVIWQSARSVCYHLLRSQREKTSVTLTIPKSSAYTALVWIKPDEVRYQGKMFDIKQRRETSSELVLTGHFDSKEDKLFRWLKNLLEERHQQQGKRKLAFWFFDATLDPFVPLMQRTFAPALKDYFGICAPPCSDGVARNFSPPPEPCNA